MKIAHLYIYGEIVNNQDPNANSVGFVSLASVKHQLESQKGFKEILTHIHCIGGDVDEGFAIYDYIRSQGKHTTSRIEGNCYSIATVVALSGNKRQMTPNSKIIIHNPWGRVQGERKDIQKYADDLETIEDDISNFYASETNLSKEESLSFMRKETKFNADEALEKGFITEISIATGAVAKYNSKQKKSKNKNKMAKDLLTKKEADKKFKSLGDSIQNILKRLGKKPVALVLQDANGKELNFSDLEEGATPKVGDKADIEGTPAEGDYVMPNGETYVFVSGELTEVKPKEEDTEDSEALAKENDELKIENKKMKKEAKKMKKDVKALSEDFEDFKKQASSSFEYDPKIKKNEKKGNRGTKSRSLFKKDK